MGYLDSMSLPGFLIILVGLVATGLVLGFGIGASVAVRSGLINLLFLVYTPPCIVLRLYDLPSPVGH